MASLGPWGTRRIAVAVSGGADSLALVMLAHDWCRTTGRELLALTVDHGLRPAAAQEARGVAGLMAAHHIPCRILTLQNLPPGPGLAMRAREARYNALFAACREAGVIDLLLGHHARDQAETLLIRREQSSGLSGLAGMSAVFLRQGIRLVRPLLALPPDDLRSELRARHIPWVEDPSNHDLRITRARIRASLAAPAIADLLAQAQAAGQARIQSETAIAAWLAANATIRPEGFAHLTSATCPPEALAALIQMVTGNPYPPPGHAVLRLARDLQPATLAGARLIKAPRRAPGFVLLREQSAIAPPAAVAQNIIWDQRFRITHGDNLPAGATIGALGPQAAQFRDCSDLPAAVLRTLPAIRNGDVLLEVPHLPRSPHHSTTGTTLYFTPPRPAAGALFRTAGT